jgi:hypothetical protein
MARKKKLRDTSALADRPDIPARPVPSICPICGEETVPVPSPSDLPQGKRWKPSTEDNLRAHLETHHPQQPCQHEHPERGHTPEWVIQWDAIRYFRSDVSPFYCCACGFHAPPVN